jgi:type I restriction enzyme S subunit
MPYLGKCALVLSLREFTVFESNMMRLNLDTSKCDLRYVTYFLCSEKGKQELKKNAKQAVNQASINQKDVANVDIPIPKIEVQREIVQFIESRLSVCDKLEQIVDGSLAKAEALRQSILKKTFAGQLVPQDPDDEPADVLLEYESSRWQNEYWQRK